jgi:hypothetical protein
METGEYKNLGWFSIKSLKSNELCLFCCFRRQLVAAKILGGNWWRPKTDNFEK